MGTRGQLGGGVSRATSGAVDVLDAAGYDYVIVETVGVGQSEVEIASIADTVVLVQVPGLGDDIQVIKAGIMEIGDVFAVNKKDRPGVERVVAEIRIALELSSMASKQGGGTGSPGRPGRVVGGPPMDVQHLRRRALLPKGMKDRKKRQPRSSGILRSSRPWPKPARA